jgi:NDP-sugar pyrophosphorylase family protein
MVSKVKKENQIIFGKKIVDILKDTLNKETNLVQKESLENLEENVYFFMANVPLVDIQHIKDLQIQYPNDLILLKDSLEEPIALYVPSELLKENRDCFKKPFESFSLWLEEIGRSYRVEVLEGVWGVNSKSDLEKSTRLLQKYINNYWMKQGVTILSSESVFIDFEVSLGMDTEIYPNSFIKGKSQIGEDCVIGPDARVDSSLVKDRAHIFDSTVLESTVGFDTKVGPYAYVRPNSILGDEVKIGDFVEIKNATLGNHTKVSHLSYVGDADVGNHVNVGCGVVFVNYDGKSKQRSTVEDYAFIGCNSNLIAPVLVEASAYVAAGTTVTKMVPSGALALGRCKQENKEGWVEKSQLIQSKK